MTSAEVGLYFMTKFGHFESTLKLELPEYRIVLDARVSLGGASGCTCRPGETDPAETHVHLETYESNETAQEMLDISEQTCFLNAFCRTDLKTKIKVAPI